ncbi:OLC1v1026417C1 [Oldenlandia corymbosa var. corymbosa]|uniref:OLC1v1026417C1 n=1 Tax=Oldenlandia corymbosa var. corymbosa TaxID=529605 RepID=A0AAV1C6Y6_OLDCO|nr:OLC1v1026417C1 [Oldenlandia corymbosa var. corymbosa]
MRTGSYTLQQSLTPEATLVVKQAVSLARRRGHAQVTPLHVASVMLASSSGLFRRACLQAHSHPLQCKALELCFNVALNRLPTSTSSPILGPHSHVPSLSNSIVAAFKRAQAHQRRGSIENQQQPILALKVELEQLVISILDDPSVSRVMREAGFSSTQVKTKVEQAVSLEIRTQTCPTVSTLDSKESVKPLVLGNSSQFRVSIGRTTAEQVREDDVMSIVGAMMNKKTKNTIIVGECLATAESVVKGVIEKFDKGNVPAEMRSVQFISVPLFTLRNISREEFEVKLGELRSLVKNYVSRGVVLYLGDLQWVSEFWSKYGEQKTSFYSPVEHMIMELSRLLCGIIRPENSGKLWIIGIATFQTYMKCKTGRPSLETLWDLHPLTIPVGSLALSLNLDSDLNHHFRSKAGVEGSSWLLCKAGGAEKNLNCCADCVANFRREARSISSSDSITNNNTSSSLPLWLQEYKDEKRRETINHDQEFEKMRDLCQKWNSICKSVHKKHPHFLEKATNFCASSPTSSASVSSNDKHNLSTNLHHHHHQSILSSWPLIFESNTPNNSIQSPKERKFFVSESEVESFEPKVFSMYKPSSADQTKPELLSNPNSSPNSASSSEASGDHMEALLPRFKENNQENHEILCSELRKKVPWQEEIIPDIVSTILECRSGKKNQHPKKNQLLSKKLDREETWLFFLGVDAEGKEKISKELSRVIFGSQDNFTAISLSCISSNTKSADSAEEVISKKRQRDEHGKSYLNRFSEAVNENPNRVFFMEDVDQIDYHSQKGIMQAIQNGYFTLPDGEKVYLKDAIVIFSCESIISSSVSRASSSPSLEKAIVNDDGSTEKKGQNNPTLDLNIATEEDGDDDDRKSLFNHEAGIKDLVDKQVLFKALKMGGSL